MKKKHILGAFIFFGSFLVVVQFLLMWFMSGFVDKRTAFLEDVQKFTVLTSRLRIPVVLIDPVALQLYQKSSDLQECLICTPHNFLQFAVLDSVLRKKEQYLASLKENGFQVVEFLGLSANGDTPITISYCLKKHSLIVQLTVFYDREGDFWWHSSIENDPSYLSKLEAVGLQFRQIHVGRHEGAYDKFASERISLHGIKLQIPVNVTSYLIQLKQSEFMECNEVVARHFNERYGKDVSSDATKFRHKAWKLLVKAKTLLDKLGVRFWLSSGTCLGYFRECDIIPHAKDVDLGVWIKDYDDRIVSEFTSHGFGLKHWFGKINDSLELSFQDGDIKLDIFFFYEEGNTYWNGGTQVKTGRKFKYVFPKFTLCWTEFLDLKVRVPCETRTYIEANYGLNWFEPVKEWDWKNSPPNVRENGVWLDSERSEVIQVYI